MLTTLALAFLTDGPPADLRGDFQRFSARLEARLASVCRPADPIAFFSGSPATRFVYLDGFGAVFLLPPRALPSPLRRRTGQADPEISVSGAHEGPQVLVIREGRPSDLTDLEARIRETRKEAERMRAQADAAFAYAERQLMPGSSDPEPVSLPVPWTLLLAEEGDDTRPPEQVEKEVKDALVATILEDSTVLKSLLPTDRVTVSVELVYRPQPWVRAKPARTITIRAVKADLDALAKGQINRDRLIERLETTAH